MLELKRGVSDRRGVETNRETETQGMIEGKKQRKKEEERKIDDRETDLSHDKRTIYVRKKGHPLIAIESCPRSSSSRAWRP